jgi:hypothetical protein
MKASNTRGVGSETTTLLKIFALFLCSLLSPFSLPSFAPIYFCVFCRAMFSPVSLPFMCLFVNTACCAPF